MVRAIGRRTFRATASNSVFLVDVSGSMTAANKLPLLKNRASACWTDTLRHGTGLSLVTYARQHRVVLPPPRR